MKVGKETELYNQGYMDGYDDAQKAHIEPIKPKIKDVKEKSFPKDDPDYWTRLEHQAAIAAMGGMCGNTSYDETTWEDMAEDAIRAAHALVEKMKEVK